MSLNPGHLAPDFTLLDSNEHPVCLSDFRGKWVILYFYPRDNTPGCTKEACGFRDAYAEFQAQDVVVLGVSTDDAKSHTKFSTKFNLPFTLLSDPEGKAASVYESYGLKKFMGKEYIGTSRNTFLIDPDGKIVKVYLKVKPEPHAAELLADLATFTS